MPERDVVVNFLRGCYCRAPEGARLVGQTCFAVTATGVDQFHCQNGHGHQAIGAFRRSIAGAGAGLFVWLSKPECSHMQAEHRGAAGPVGFSPTHHRRCVSAARANGANDRSVVATPGLVIERKSADANVRDHTPSGRRVRTTCGAVPGRQRQTSGSWKGTESVWERCAIIMG